MLAYCSVQCSIYHFLVFGRYCHPRPAAQTGKTIDHHQNPSTLPSSYITVPVWRSTTFDTTVHTTYETVYDCSSTLPFHRQTVRSFVGPFVVFLPCWSFGRWSIDGCSKRRRCRLSIWSWVPWTDPSIWRVISFLPPFVANRSYRPWFVVWTGSWIVVLYVRHNRRRYNIWCTNCTYNL
jgi:hypothetical protein